MLKRRHFTGGDASIKQFREELRRIATAADADLDGKFDDVSEREITFFDTRDRRLAAAGLILRRRVRKKKVEYTLKCRSPDRYIAAAADVRSAKGFRPDVKFEEDIAAPFQSRFSHSNTIEIPRDEDPGEPETIKNAMRMFPAVRGVGGDRARWLHTPLISVSGKTAFERVFTGPEFELETKRASVALIVWSSSRKGRALLVEFSFRYESPKEEFPPRVAIAAQRLFDELQKSKWFDPDARTKTQFMFDA